jgi:hypothetical protein
MASPESYLVREAGSRLNLVQLRQPRRKPGLSGFYTELARFVDD